MVINGIIACFYLENDFSNFRQSCITKRLVGERHGANFGPWRSGVYMYKVRLIYRYVFNVMLRSFGAFRFSRFSTFISKTADCRVKWTQVRTSVVSTCKSCER